jgi:hypothetical protein
MFKDGTGQQVQPLLLLMIMMMIFHSMQNTASGKKIASELGHDCSEMKPEDR